jgi:branched-chain amino acid aminotransferase
MAFSMQSSKGYFRDGLVNFDEMNVSIASASVLYGLGVYTVFYCGWDKHNDQLWAFRLEDHYKRLCQSAKIMSFPSFEEQYSLSQFRNLLLNMIRVNKVKDNVLVRVSLFVDEHLSGTKTLGLRTSLAAFIYPASPMYPASGIHVGVSSWNRTPDNAIPARAKVHGNYVNASLAKNEALAAGYDEAILLDNQGQVAESTVTNVCIVRDGMIISPAPSTDLLEGITVRTIESLAQHLNIPFVWRAIDRTELSIADEIFLTGSSAGVTPVLSVNKQPVGTGQPGPIALKLNSLYAEIRTGSAAEFRHWLTPVYEKKS